MEYTPFALDLYRRIAGDENLILSPYSIATAMAMLAAGAGGETAAELERAMHFPFSGPRLAKAWSAVHDDVNRRDDFFELLTANALWAQLGIEFRSGYLEMIRRLDGTIETLDFGHASRAACARINEWVAEITRGKIPKLVDGSVVSDETLMILTNAIYMKAPWADKFEAWNTMPGDFHTKRGTVSAPMMHHTARFAFLRDERVRVIELPYRGSGLSMLIALPEAHDGLAALEAQLSPERIGDWDASLRKQRVALTMPRFAIESAFALSSTLGAMGVRLAFDTEGRSDFSGISETQKLAISEVIHKARIDVTEDGTEAAAATALVLRAGAAFRAEKPEVFRADHPFLFLIRRKKNLLFMGRVVNPVSAAVPATSPAPPA